MLQYEQDVEEDADVSQPELDRVSRHAGPVPLQGGVEYQLHDR